MDDKLTTILDDVLVRIAGGEDVEAVLADYPEDAGRIRPLVRTAANLTSSERAVPSRAFRDQATARLAARIHTEAATPWWRRLGAVLPTAPRVLAPAALAVLLTVVVSAGIWFGLDPRGDVAAMFRLADLEGTIEVMPPAGTAWVPAGGDEALPAGARVRTADDGRVRLSFTDGSTIVLEPGTEVSVDRIEQPSRHETLVSVSQIRGVTVTQAAAGPTATRFEVMTEAAQTTAEGASFVTEVAEDGKTTVRSLDGAVSVSSRAAMVTLTSGEETKVAVDAAPAPPEPGSEDPPGTRQEEAEPEPDLAPVAPVEPESEVPADGTVPGQEGDSGPGEDASGTLDPEEERPETKPTVVPENPDTGEKTEATADATEPPTEADPVLTPGSKLR
jgi:hypothetical protein